MFKNVILILFLFSVRESIGQKWVDTVYNITIQNNITYGSAIDFGGNLKSLKLDVATPIGDNHSPCGRPLILIIHGGGFLGGSKQDGYVRNWLIDFAKRGYTTASIDYRLGMFTTDKEIHCNITNLFNFPWDCMNETDSIEWYRAYFRAVQDAHRAIHFLINEPAYQIDQRNVFVIGESAGAITSLGFVYLDHKNELLSYFGSQNTVKSPNKIYDFPCIQTLGFDTSIASLTLDRPDLIGDLDPTQNRNFTIKGIASIYGATLQDLFTSNTYSKIPLLYMYHQPNDIVVDMNRNKLLQGIESCAASLGSCGTLINRPMANGSQAIYQEILRLKNIPLEVPEVTFEKTNNQVDCLGQLLNPSAAGHSIDNYWTRTLVFAKLFAQKIEESAACYTTTSNATLPSIKIFPNPAKTKLYIDFLKYDEEGFQFSINNLSGVTLISSENFRHLPKEINVSSLPSGVYILTIVSLKNRWNIKIVID